MINIADNLTQIRQNIAKCAVNAGRTGEDVRLIAVSKTQPAAAIAEAYAAGQTDFGENYLQEAAVKMEQLAQLNIQWHFLGPIQSNKTKSVAELFSWVHSVDRFKVAKRLSDQRPSSLPPLQVCLQVNIDNQASKSGCEVAQALDLAVAISQLPQMQLRGLMAVPAPNSGAEPFNQLNNLMQQINSQTSLKLDTLSMGMSADMDVAIAAGANMVRIGTAVFGPRQTSNRV